MPSLTAMGYCFFLPVNTSISLIKQPGTSNSRAVPIPCSIGTNCTADFISSCSNFVKGRSILPVLSKISQSTVCWFLVFALHRAVELFVRPCSQVPHMGAVWCLLVFLVCLQDPREKNRKRSLTEVQNDLASLNKSALGSVQICRGHKWDSGLLLSVNLVVFAADVGDHNWHLWNPLSPV